MAIDRSIDIRLFERRLFLIVALAFAVIIFIGFARTYYLMPVIGGSPLRSITHIHGLTMSLWVALFAVQVYLVRSKNLKLHMSLGRAAVLLGMIIVPVGVLTALMATKYGSPSAPPDIPSLNFLIVPITDIALFAAFFGAAIYFRKRPADHKRLMMLSAINFLPPAIARIPVGQLQSLGPLWFFGVPDLILLTIIAIDRWRTGKFNKALVIGAAILIASHPLRLMLSGTAPWVQFAAWATSFV